MLEGFNPSPRVGERRVLGRKSLGYEEEEEDGAGGKRDCLLVSSARALGGLIGSSPEMKRSEKKKK